MSDSGAFDSNASRLLRSLRLTAEHVQVLRKQGCVCAEIRANGRTYFKLRFRHRGQQVVRYLGKDPEKAKAVARALKELQATRRMKQHTRQLKREARILLRQAKFEMEPLVEHLGFRVHGFQVRRRKKEQ